MTIENVVVGAMGEQPIFSTKAHVFHIDPQTKKSWIHASSSAINVSFFYDSTRNLYRIISVEGTKAVINSTITSNMTFTKTSQKFGQWSDVRANTVYGLGFSSEADLNKFIEKFQEIKEALKQNAQSSAKGQTTPLNGQPQPQSQPPTSSAQTPAVTSSSSASGSPINTRTLPKPPLLSHIDDGQLMVNQERIVTTVKNEPIDVTNSNLLRTSLVAHQRSQSLSGLQPVECSPKHQSKLPPSGLSSTASSIDKPTSVSPLPGGSSLEAQLKYENDRLKLALAQSSANAKKWEVELSTLKNNNARLTSALQESTSNVEEWKKQLQTYKEENSKLKVKMLELEASRGNVDAAAELRKELHILRLKVELLENETRHKETEVQRMTKLMEDVQLQHHGTSGSGTFGHRHDDTIKNLQLENESLKNSMTSLQRQMDATVAAQDASRRLAETIHVQLGEKLGEVLELHREVANALST